MSARLSAISSSVGPNAVTTDDMAAFLCARAAPSWRSRLRRTIEASGSHTRHTVLPLDALARLQGAGERSALYRQHAFVLAERAVARLTDAGILFGDDISTIIFVSSTGWAAPSIDTHLVRRFGINDRCRRVPLAQLGCAGGAAALSLAAAIARDRDERVLIVSVEVPSLQLQFAEPSYWELVTAAQFGDGSAAAIVSHDDRGWDVLGTQSVLLREGDEGGRILACETGFRLVSSSGLPDLIRSRARELVARFASGYGVDPATFSFVAAHPRGGAVLDAVAEALSLQPSKLAAAYSTWAHTSNMVSASIYRVLAHLAREGSLRRGDVGLAMAFGTGVACELALLRWRSEPVVLYS